MKTGQLGTLLARDARLIWHPYTQHLNMLPLLPIVKGKDCWLIDENGNRYLDAISSWWTNLHGHAHPFIAEKIYEQALKMHQVIFAGCTHEPAVQLAESLLPLLPGNQAKLFFSDNGSTAVEVALKMAIQYHQNQGKPRKKILALKHAYHGDTFGAMSVSERGIFTLPFDQFLFEVVFIDPQSADSLLSQFNQYDASSFAAFIYEPLVQGAGGMNMYNGSNLDELLGYLQNENILCIADEVMTGFGRTGKLFASSDLVNYPDIICLSKGLTGGTMPMALTTCSQKIFDAFLSEGHTKTFFHGHSFTANPLACAAANASLELLLKNSCQQNIDLITSRNQEMVRLLKNKSNARNVRALGTILAFEIDSPDKDYRSSIKEMVIKYSLDKGILLRPLGNTVYIMPPYCITGEELDYLYEALKGI